VEVVSMYHLTRAATTLLGAAVAGVLLWLATQVLSTNGTSSTGEYWGAVGLVALAGLTMALSQLLGGWTKWGWPRVSLRVFLIAFLPVLIVGGWMLAAGAPGDEWLGSHVRNWSGDLGIDSLVTDLTRVVPAIAFGIGLVFGFTFDTTGPRIRKAATPVPTAEAQPTPTEQPERNSEQETVATGDGDGNGSPEERRVYIRHGGGPDESASETSERTTER
jgi:hypothetical protein